MVAALVNTPNQSAGEIVREMSEDAYKILKGASRFVGGKGEARL